MRDVFTIAVALVALVAGAVASVVGFGIGSMLTPLVGVQVGLRAAVVVVSVPHFAATVLRAWRLRRAIDRVVLVRFGLASAAGRARRRAAPRTIGEPGALSGVFGGLVGNQGGIRSAALLGFDLPREAFVATATAVGVIVDLARMPVYLATSAGAIAASWRLVVALGVVIIVRR